MKRYRNKQTGEVVGARILTQPAVADGFVVAHQNDWLVIHNPDKPFDVATGHTSCMGNDVIEPQFEEVEEAVHEAGTMGAMAAS